jgi:hypothetical protein
MTMLPNTNGTDTAEERYGKCVSFYNAAAGRYNAALDWLDAAQREYDDAERWLTEARDDLNRAAAVLGLPGTPQ